MVAISGLGRCLVDKIGLHLRRGRSTTRLVGLRFQLSFMNSNEINFSLGQNSSGVKIPVQFELTELELKKPIQKG